MSVEPTAVVGGMQTDSDLEPNEVRTGDENCQSFGGRDWKRFGGEQQLHRTYSNWLIPEVETASSISASEL